MNSTTNRQTSVVVENAIAKSQALPITAKEPVLSISEAINLVRELLARPIAYHAVFAKVAGSVAGGILLSQLYYWQPRCGDPNGWIYKTETEWQEETYLSRREQQTARKQLISAGVLETKRKGVPARLYYRLDLDALYKQILSFSCSPPPQNDKKAPENLTQSQLSENAQLVERKRTTRSAESPNWLSENAQLEGTQTLTQHSFEAPLIDYTENTTHTTIHCPQPDGSRQPHPKSVCVDLKIEEKQPKEEFQVSGNNQESIEKSLPVKKSLDLDQNAAPRRENNSQKTKEEILMGAGIAPEDFDQYLKHVASTLKQKTTGAALTAIANNPARATLSYEEWKKQSAANIPTLSTKPMAEMPHTFHATMRQYLNNPKLSRERFLRIDYAAEWLEWSQANHPEWFQNAA
jgi:hypothetical protein